MLAPTLGRFLLLAGFWIALVGSERTALAIGGAVVPLVLWVSVQLAPARPVHMAPLLRLGPRFATMAIAGSLDVARRALRRRPRLSPALVEVPIELEDARARLMLSSLVSLIPGTVGVALGARTLVLHVLDDHMRDRTLADVEQLEHLVRRVVAAPARPAVRPGGEPS